MCDGTLGVGGGGCEGLAVPGSGCSEGELSLQDLQGKIWR